MNIPLEVSYRGVEKTDALEALIQEKVSKLEEVCDHISRCQIAIEKAHTNPSSGSPYRVRIDLTVPPGHELAAVKNPDDGTQYIPLEAVIRDTFEAARRQLQELSARQRNEVKTHAQQSITAVVTQLFPEQDYGLIKSLDGQDIHFDRSSMLHDDFEWMEIGTGVQFFLVETEAGPRAVNVKIISKPGVRVGKAETTTIPAPRGWQ